MRSPAKRASTAARKAFEQALSKDAKFFPAILGLAALELGDGKPELARTRLEAALQSDPDNIDVHMALAELTARTGGGKEAVAALFFWQNLTESVFFRKHAEEWRFLAATKRKQLAFKAIVEEVKNNGKSSFTAAKYLIEEPWKTGNAMERKRNKKMVSDSADIAFNESTIQSDIKRLREDGVLN